MISALGIAALALALAVTAGGLALRLGGAFAFWAGTAGLATTGDPRAIPVATLGAAAWAAGQIHFALRHGGAAKGPAAALLLAGAASLLRRPRWASPGRADHRPLSAHDETGDR